MDQYTVTWRAAMVSRPRRWGWKEVAENPPAELEPLGHGGGGAHDVGLLPVPGPHVVFRPEEVQGGSEHPTAAFGPVVRPADPHHEPRRLRPRAFGLYREG